MDQKKLKPWIKWALHVLGFAITTALASQLIPVEYRPGAEFVSSLLSDTPQAAPAALDGGAQ